MRIKTNAIFHILFNATRIIHTHSHTGRRIRRVHIGIYTVLNASFSPQQPPLPLEYIQYSCGHR